MNSRNELLTEIEAFFNKNPEISISRFGLDVSNDSHLVPKLREGRDIRLSTMDAIRIYMNENCQYNNATAE